MGGDTSFFLPFVLSVEVVVKHFQALIMNVSSFKLLMISETVFFSTLLGRSVFKFSIELNVGLCEGNSRSLMLACLIHTKTHLDKCLGSLSCWNIQQCPSFNHQVSIPSVNVTCTSKALSEHDTITTMVNSW